MSSSFAPRQISSSRQFDSHSQLSFRSALNGRTMPELTSQLRVWIPAPLSFPLRALSGSYKNLLSRVFISVLRQLEAFYSTELTSYSASESIQ